MATQISPNFNCGFRLEKAGIVQQLLTGLKHTVQLDNDTGPKGQ